MKNDRASRVKFYDRLHDAEQRKNDVARGVDYKIEIGIGKMYPDKNVLPQTVMDAYRRQDNENY